MKNESAITPPIAHHAPLATAQPPRQQSVAPQPVAPAATANTPLPKRSETPRSRAADSRSDTPRVPDADSLWFEQLLALPATGQEAQSDARGGASNYSLFAPFDGMPTQLIDQLALQLPALGRRPFSATLLMPTLGKVQVRAHKRDSCWAIDLAFERAEVLQRVNRHHSACESALTQALGHDVELSLHPAGDA